MNKKIIILERRLFSAFGHERTQIETINEYFENSSSYVISCKNTSLSKLNLKNKFILNMPEFLIKKEGKESESYIKDSAHHLEMILSRSEFKTNTNILIPSARTTEISMLTILFNENKFPKNILPIVRILGINYLSDLPKKILNSFINLVNNKKIKLFSETEELATKIKAKYKVKFIKPLMFPVSVPLDYIPDKLIANKSINIGCLGGPRPSKGTYLIPGLVKNLRKYIRENNEDISITFIVQMSKEKKKREFIFRIKEIMSRHISKLVRVKIVYGTDSRKDFMSLINTVDIFLLPYKKKQYKYSGSGFIIDALLLQKPIIISEGIAMRELTNFKNSITFKNALDFPEATVKLIKTYQNYSKNRQTARKYLINKINNSFKYILEDI